jgi:hypothetical protein
MSKRSNAVDCDSPSVAILLCAAHYVAHRLSRRSQTRSPVRSVAARLESIPSGLVEILSNHDASNRLTGIFHFLGVCASGSRSGVLGSKTAVPLQHGVV